MGEIIKKESEKRLKVGETIKKIIRVYKTGFKQFMVLSLISIITSLGMTAVRIVMPFSITIAILIFILSILSIYLALRANAGYFLLTQNILQGEKRTIKESFQQTKGFAATYFAITIMYGLILLVPCAGIWFSYSFISNSVIKFALIGFLLIPLTYLAVRYCLAIPSALLMGDSGGLESSKLLVKGDFRQVLAVIVLTEGIILGLYQVLVKVTGLITEFWPAIFMAILTIAFQILIQPITGITSTIMYLDLNKTKGVDILPSENYNKMENAVNMSIEETGSKDISY